MGTGRLYMLAAFTNSPDGGNPAGVWIGEKLPNSDIMQNIAAEVGFSKTAFVEPTNGKFENNFFKPTCTVLYSPFNLMLAAFSGDDNYRKKHQYRGVSKKVDDDNNGHDNEDHLWQRPIRHIRKHAVSAISHISRRCYHLRHG